MERCVVFQVVFREIYKNPEKVKGLGLKITCRRFPVLKMKDIYLYLGIFEFFKGIPNNTTYQKRYYLPKSPVWVLSVSIQKTECPNFLRKKLFLCPFVKKAVVFL